MNKSLRKKLRVGEFQAFYCRATISIQAEDQWSSFNAAVANFMAETWRRWGFGYGESVGERQFVINVGTRYEAESRRNAMIRWLEQRDDIRLVTVDPVDYKDRRYQPRRRTTAR